MKARRIKTQTTGRKIQLGGWLNGKRGGTYIRLECEGVVDWVDGQSLYRLAKAIVKQFEQESSR